MKRILCLWLPNWPVQRRETTRPQLRTAPLLLTETVRGKETIRYCNQPARRLGIAPGSLLADARSLAGNAGVLLAEPVEPQEDRRALEKLAIACEAFSPCVGLEDLQPPESLLLDITGVAHLFAGEAPLAQKLAARFSRWKLTARIGVSDSVGSAWAAAHFRTSKNSPQILPVGDYSALHQAPVACLRLSEQILQLLARLGIRTAGQLLKLNRHSLPARFGRELNMRREQFLARCEELITPHRAEPCYRVGRTLQHGVTQPAAVETLFEALLQKLMKPLRERSLGTRRVDCLIDCDNRQQLRIAVRLCQLTSATRHVCELFRLHLERAEIPAPVIAMWLEALDPAPLQWEQLEVFDGAQQAVQKELPVLLNRLSSRLGEDAVVQPQLTHYALPERSYRYTAITNKQNAAGPAALPLRLHDRPFCIYAQPKEFQLLAEDSGARPTAMLVEGARWIVSRWWGPERIESDWWCGPLVRRDYYRVEIANGSWFWVFQQLTDGRWFLHGEF